MRRILAATALTAATLAVPAAPAFAGGSCGAGTAMPGVTVDDVGPVDTVNWYRYEGLAAQYVVTLTPLVIAEANLTVANSACGTECTSDQGENFPDICLVSAPDGILNIAVRFAFGGPFDSTFVLTVTPVLPTFE